MVKQPGSPQVPGYRILRELGHGGMATVYLAEQESIEREVALKVMSPALGAADPSFSARFVREAKIVAKLAHPHITAVYDVGVAGSCHYFSMEYVTGGDLKSRIREGMMPKLAFIIIRQVASALAFAHAKGYVHRDVKPENVLFRQDGTALLTDFGIAFEHARGGVGYKNGVSRRIDSSRPRLQVGQGIHSQGRRESEGPLGE